MSLYVRAADPSGPPSILLHPILVRRYMQIDFPLSSLHRLYLGGNDNGSGFLADTVKENLYVAFIFLTFM